LIGLAGCVPLIGQGRVAWLAERNGRAAVEYVKPSPVQALAAIGARRPHGNRRAARCRRSLRTRHAVGPLAALAGPVCVVCWKTRQAAFVLRGRLSICWPLPGWT